MPAAGSVCVDQLGSPVPTRRLLYCWVFRTVFPYFFQYQLEVTSEKHASTLSTSLNTYFSLLSTATCSARLTRCWRLALPLVMIWERRYTAKRHLLIPFFSSTEKARRAHESREIVSRHLSSETEQFMGYGANLCVSFDVSSVHLISTTKRLCKVFPVARDKEMKPCGPK